MSGFNRKKTAAPQGKRNEPATGSIAEHQEENVIFGVRKMNKGDVRRLLDKLWAARLGVVSASGGVSNMPLFMSVEDRRKRLLFAVEEQDHIDLISSSSDYDSDDMDDETLAKRSCKSNSKKEIYNRIMKQKAMRPSCLSTNSREIF